MQQTILIIDDHPNMRMLVAEYLAEQGYRVLAASDGVEGLEAAQREHPDLILLDLMLPNLDGFSFMRLYRSQQQAPVIMLTARMAEADKVVGLELGADDYITKPFGMRELLARVRAVLRRAAAERLHSADELYRVGELVLNRSRHRVTLGSQVVELTPSEFALLAALIALPGRVFSREQLMQRLQGGDYEGVERTIDVHVRNLRRKIEPDPARPRYIETIYGVGYRLAVDEAGA